MSAADWGTSLIGKLGIKRGLHIGLVDAAENYGDLLVDLLDGVTSGEFGEGCFDPIHLFTRDR